MRVNFGGILSRLRLRLRVLAGTIYNLAGVPGLVRECEYRSEVADANIKVSVRQMFTIVRVNGLEIYFHRLTGTIDGVGTTSDCRADPVGLSTRVPGPPSVVTLKAAKQGQRKTGQRKWPRTELFYLAAC